MSKLQISRKLNRLQIRIRGFASIPHLYLCKFWYINKEKIVVDKDELSRKSFLKGVKTDKAIRSFAKCSSGKRILFHTQSQKVVILVAYKDRMVVPHMSLFGTAGLDLYRCNSGECTRIASIAPNNELQMIVKKEIDLGREDDDFILYLPLFAEIRYLAIISKDGKCIKKIVSDKKPIVIYGSSISQGCASSRSGLSYVNILSQYYHRDVVNYGFSESARGQQEIIDGLSRIDSGLVIMEYDYNADLDTLRSNHLETYKVIRRNNKNVNIIYMTRFFGSGLIEENEFEQRKAIISATVKYAHNHGDRKVEMISLDKICEHIDNFLVDDRHPNDCGMMIIANEIVSLIERMKISGFDKKTDKENYFI